MSTPDKELSNVYPTLDYPELTDHSLFDEFFVVGLKATVKQLRDEFLRSWDESVEFERRVVELIKNSPTRTSIANQQSQFQEQRSRAYQKTRNNLFRYVHALYENQLNSPTARKFPITLERIAQSTQTLRDHISGLNGDSSLLDTLIEELGILQSGNQEFIFKVFLTLHNELLNRQLSSNQQIVDLRTEIDRNRTSVDKKIQTALAAEKQLLVAEIDKSAKLTQLLQSAEKSNSSLANENESLRLRLTKSDEGNSTLVEDNEKETSELRDKILNLERDLKDLAKKANDRAYELTDVADELRQSRIREHDLRVENDLTLQKLEKAECSIEELETKTQQLSDEIQELNVAKLDLEKNLEGASEHIVDKGAEYRLLDEEYNKSLKALNQATTDLNQTRERLTELRHTVSALEETNKRLNIQIADLQLAATAHSDVDYEAIDKTLLGEITTVEDERIQHLENTITSLTLKLFAQKETPADVEENIKALKDELKDVETRLSNCGVKLREQVARAQTAEQKLKQSEREVRRLTELERYCQARHVHYKQFEEKDNRVNELEKEIAHLQNSMSLFGSIIPDNDATGNATTAANTSLRDLETSIVKGLGEMFTREDKRNIRVYKGKSSDPPITTWLKEAEITAALNNWDDQQKIRFFSDRLKDEAAEWLLEFFESNGPFSYDDWKQSLITRFRNEADVEHMKHALQNLKQGPEQRTQSFIAKINSMFDDVHGTERRYQRVSSEGTNCNDDDNPANKQSDDLLKELKRMRDEAKRKILIRGLLPKYKTELWSRITKDASFEEVCQAALSAESIVIQKDLSDDKSLIVANVQTEQIKEKEKEIEQKQTIIDMLKEQNEFLKTYTGKIDSQGPSSEAATVGAVGNQNQQSGILKSGNKNVQFKEKSQKQGTGQSNKQFSNPNTVYPSGGKKQKPTGQNAGIYPYRPFLNPYPAHWVPQQVLGYGYPPVQQLNAQQANLQTQQGPQQGPAQVPWEQVPQQGPAQVPWGQQPQVQQNYVQQPPPQQNWYQNQSGNWVQTQQNQQGQTTQQGTQNRREIVCYQCNKKGHTKRECWHNPANQTQKQ